MQIFKPGYKYRFVYKESSNNKIIETSMELTFTEENNIFPDEFSNKFDCFEFYDSYDSRFICYINLQNQQCQLVSEADPNDNKSNYFYPAQIYLDNSLIFSAYEHE